MIQAFRVDRYFTQETRKHKRIVLYAHIYTRTGVAYIYIYISYAYDIIYDIIYTHAYISRVHERATCSLQR